jgi:hypothetical protein
MPHQALWIWLVGDGIGGAFTAIVCSVVARKRPVHSPQIARTNRQMFWFWLRCFYSPMSGC